MAISTTGTDSPSRLSLAAKLVSSLASLKITLALMVALMLFTLLGAWLPQGKTGTIEVAERFGGEAANLLDYLRLTNIFYSPLYSALIALLFINLLACTATRMSGKVKARLVAPKFLDRNAINKLPIKRSLLLNASPDRLFDETYSHMKGQRFFVAVAGNSLYFEKGSLALLAAPVTHLGLFFMLAGILVTTLTGYQGDISMSCGERLSFPPPFAQKPIVGTLPKWSIELTDTSRKNYDSGEAKQWNSTIKISDANGATLSKGTVSVNNPFTFGHIDFYQSDWGLDSVKLKLASASIDVPLRGMGKQMVGASALTDELILVVATTCDTAPLKVYLKENEASPVFLGGVKPGRSLALGTLILTYEGACKRSGIHYKKDPGLPLIYTSFFFLSVGAFLVAVPNYKIFASLQPSSDNRTELIIGAPGGRLARLVRNEIKALGDRLSNSQIKEEVR